MQLVCIESASNLVSGILMSLKVAPILAAWDCELKIVLCRM
jgi:hypothetical protein